MLSCNTVKVSKSRRKHGEHEKCTKLSDKKPHGKRALGRPKQRFKYIKMNLRETV
jgi:hypothetical protein